MDNKRKSIKWRMKAPAYRVGIAAGTIVALVATTGAPFKWGG